MKFFLAGVMILCGLVVIVGGTAWAVTVLREVGHWHFAILFTVAGIYAGLQYAYVVGEFIEEE